jgi:adenylate cyclase
VQTKHALRLLAEQLFGPRLVPLGLRRAMLAGLIGLLLLALRVFDPGPVERVRLSLFDFWQYLQPRTGLIGGTAVVDIDAESLAVYGQWPWPRDLMAQLVRRVSAGGPSVVGLDILFPEPDRLSPQRLAAVLDPIDPELERRLAALPSTDALLADSFRGSRVVLAMAPGAAGPRASAGPSTAIMEMGADPRPFLAEHRGLVRSLDQLDAAAAGRGDASVESERDGVVRRHAAVVRVGSGIVSSIVVEMLRVMAGQQAVTVTADAWGVTEIAVGNRHLPTDGQGRIWLHYAPHDPARFVSARALLAGAVPPDVLRGRPVLIAATATGLSDVLATPLATPMAGAEIHAQLLDAILTGAVLARPTCATALELGLTLLAGLLVVAFGMRLPLRSLVAVLGGVFIGLFGLSWGAYAGGELLLDASYPAFSAGALTILMIGQRMVAEQRAREAREGELREALLRAEAASVAKSEFLANMSHELRTPLTAIIGFSEVMHRELFGPIAPNYRDYAGSIHASGEHLLGLVNDILDTARIEAGAAELQETALDAQRVMRDAERMVTARAEAKQLTIAMPDAPDLPRLRADERLLRQMLLNLLSNAVKFTAPGGGIRFAAGLDRDGSFVITVADTGIGISAEDLPRVVQPFNVVDRAMSGNYSGIGLGLPLTKAIVEQHGGRLELKSALGVGTEASLRFPAHRVVLPPPDGIDGRSPP